MIRLASGHADGLADVADQDGSAWARLALNQVSQLCLPVIVPVTEFRDVMGVGLTNLLGGADPATEMKRATEEFRPILARSEGK